jgi:tripartite-type tricarboxylate transporter receptor subunit TctC
MLQRRTALLSLAGSILTASTAVRAQAPSRTVQLVVPFAAGGSIDALARLIAPRMADSLGQTVVVNNVPGAGGAIGVGQVSRAAPDGHTLLVMPINLAMMPALYRKLPFDASTAFTPVTQLIASELVLVGSPQLPVEDVRQLIALAKREPTRLNYGSTGVASPLHLAVELLKTSAGIEIQAIPYRGDGLIITALIAGDVQVAVLPIAVARPQIEAGKLKALAVTAARRNRNLPNVPTVAEGGVAGYDVSSWQGLFAPAQMPAETLRVINEAAVKAIQAPDIRERLLAQAQEPVGSSTREFAARFQSDVATFKEVVRKAQIPPQD